MLSLLLFIAQAEEPQCLSAYGTSACGFDCKAAYGQVGCAPTPAGRCVLAYDKVTCSGDTGWTAEPARCIANDGAVACGYNCRASKGKAACSSTPQGRCTIANGVITCTDPPRQRYRYRGRLDHTQCLTAHGMTACGYKCKAAFGQVVCSDHPKGDCRVDAQDIECFVR